MVFNLLLSALLTTTSACENRSIVVTDYEDAIRFCSRQGLRLLTPREWAQRGVKLGARGIRETQYPNVSIRDRRVAAEIDRLAGEGYSLVYRLNAKRAVVVDFYFNRTGYRRPSGPEGDYFFWSSLKNPYEPQHYAGGFDGASGYIDAATRSTENDAAVCCTRD